MARIFTYFLLIVTMLSVISCKDKKNNNNDSLTKMDYKPESNPVEIIILTKADFPKQLSSNGKLYAQKKSALSFKSPGQIVLLNATNGGHVNKGDVIAVIDTTETKFSYIQAAESLEKATIDLYDALIGYGYNLRDTSNVPKDILRTLSLRSGYTNAKANLETAGRNLNNAYLRAPFTGKIASLKHRLYENTSGEFCTLIDDNTMDVEFNILESELKYITKGQTIKAATYDDLNNYITGEVTQINPMVDEKGLIKITAQVHNKGKFIDGMNVKVFVENVVPDQLVVPKSSVVIRDNLDVLFRVKNGRAAWTYVNTVMANSDSYVVKANVDRGADLSVGDTIIISGNMNLADGSYIEIRK